MIIMQGKRRVGQKEGEFGETLDLFRQLIELFNTKTRNTPREINNPQNRTEAPHIQKRVMRMQTKQRSKGLEKKRKQQKKQQIKLRSLRDWEGLCSQRKKDVFEEYALCFQYSMVQKTVKNTLRQENVNLQSLPLSHR